MNELAALLFDVDGTLAETDRYAHRMAFNETFKIYELEWYWSESLYGELLAVSGGKERLHFYVEHYQPQLLQRKDLREFIAQLYHDKTQRYIDILKRERIPLRPGVMRLFKEAKQAGLKLAIVTTTNEKNVIALLRYSLHPEILEWFAVIAAGDVVTAKKPAPDIYHYALEKLGLKANQCLAIEDSENGLQAACGAKICTVITVNDYTVQQDFTEAVLVVDHLGEPEQPFQVISGQAYNAQWVDVALLRKLLNAWERLS